jgi:putative MATE family efflux protein
MTEGKILKKICVFAIPCILTRILQNMYSLVDSAMVGAASLAAVGAAGAIISLFNDSLLGLVSGFSVVAGNKYGAGNFEKLKKVFANSLIITALVSIVISVLGAIFSYAMLVFMQTPEEIIDEARKYMVVIFAGIWSAAFYNFLGEMLRAVGNSLASLVFLVVSFTAHILLNIVLLFVFKTGVVGVAASTVLSQMASASLCVVYINKKTPFFKLKLGDIKPDREIIKECLHMGIPTAVTNFVVMFGVIILSFVTNKMGTEYIAGYSCASKMGYIITAPIFGFATAASVFVSQNMGANKFDRIKEGVRITIIFTTAVNVGLFILTKIIARPILNALLSGETVGVEAGILYLNIRTVAMFWLTIAAVYKSVIVALGKPFFATVSGFLEIAVRYIVPITLAASLGFAAVPMTDAITWLMLAVFLMPAYIYEFKKAIKRATLYEKQ